MKDVLSVEVEEDDGARRVVVTFAPIEQTDVVVEENPYR